MAYSMTAVITSSPCLARVISSGRILIPSQVGATAVMLAPRFMTTFWRLVTGTGTWADTRTPEVSSCTRSSAERSTLVLR